MGQFDIRLSFCQICGVDFGTEVAKLKHDEVTHSLKAFCHICRKGFKTALGFKTHQKQHDISLGKTRDCFKCETCGNFFPTQSRLRQHMRCHSDHRPFVCNKCGRGYKHNCDLKIHSCLAENKQ